MTRAPLLAVLSLAACTNTVTVIGEHDLAAARDFAASISDMSTLDMSSSDSSISDMATLDMSISDMAPADIAMSTDMATPADMAQTPPDLTQLPPDLYCNSLDCTNPPPADCSDANTTRTYLSPGSCAGVSNQCTYSSTGTSCANGCYLGACSSLFLGNTDAFISGTGTRVGLFGGSAMAGTSVSAITQTFPQNAVSTIHLIYSINDRAFGSPVDLTMLFDHIAGNNDQWYAIIPAQSAGAHVYWYVKVFPLAGTPGTDPHGAPAAAVLDYTN